MTIAANLIYNTLLNVSFSGESATEPVTAAEFKTHHRITHADDDAYITTLIAYVRAAFEGYTGVGLISRTVTAILYNMKGNVALPYGPVTAFTSLADKIGTVITSDGYDIYPDVTGFPYIESPTSEYLKAIYVAGYTNVTIPKQMKWDLLKTISAAYEHRGDEKELNNALARFATKHRRTPGWLI